MTADSLVLFDVDGTLLTTRGVAAGAIRDALLETFGAAGPVDSYPFMGKTDPQIMSELLSVAGVDPTTVEASLATALERYLELLAARLETHHVRLCPGVRAVLERLAADHRVVLGLLTGNLAGGAHCKLAAAGLGHLFAVGAYGSDDADRNRLVPVARERARRLSGSDHGGIRTVVVGDAPPDVACAQAAGARAVAVASGWTPAAELAALRPHALLTDLSDTDHAVATILGLE